MDAIRQASYNDPNQLQRSNGWAFMQDVKKEMHVQKKQNLI